MKNEKSKRQGDKSKQEEQYKELQATISRNEQVIAMLKMQLAHYQQQKTGEDSESVRFYMPFLYFFIYIYIFFLKVYYARYLSTYLSFYSVASLNPSNTK